MYKLIASDVDGTLVDDYLEIPERNSVMIERAKKEKDIIFCLCSGRSEQSLMSFEKKLNLIDKNTYGISFNGSVVYESWSRKYIRDIRLDRDLTINIAKELDFLPFDVMLYAGNTIYVLKDKDYFESFARLSESSVQLINSFEDAKEEFTKILIHASYEELISQEKYMSQIALGQCNRYFTAKDLYEFSPTEATKGNGLIFLANYLGIPIEETIGIGDYYNDLHLISVAGLGVCVQNGVEEAKDIANYVTKATNNQGAVGEVIEKFIF